MAEIEIRILDRQCIGRRIANAAALGRTSRRGNNVATSNGNGSNGASPGVMLIEGWVGIMLLN